MENSESFGRQIVPFIPTNKGPKYMSLGPEGSALNTNAISNLAYYPSYAKYSGNRNHQRKFPSLDVNINPDGIATDSRISSNTPYEFSVSKNILLLEIISDNPNIGRNRNQYRYRNRRPHRRSHRRSHLRSQPQLDLATCSAILIIIAIAILVYYMK